MQVLRRWPPRCAGNSNAGLRAIKEFRPGRALIKPERRATASSYRSLWSAHHEFELRTRDKAMRRTMVSCSYVRKFCPYLAGILVLATSACCFGQDATPAPSHQTSEEKLRTTLVEIRRLPAEWLIGPYVPSSKPLTPLNNEQRADVYFHQTYLTAAAYGLRMVSAGVDQARGVPYQWGGGVEGYGRRFASRYGEFIIANTFHSVGNAALGYETRYDLCRCTRFWPRTQHAIMRNFMTYDRTETERRLALPLYLGSFGAGMISSVWFPKPHDVWRDGAYAALGQAGWGTAYNFVSEFAIDILRKVTGQKYPRIPHAASEP